MSKFEDDERFDGLYLNVAQTTRGIEPLLDTVFGFLRRKTDFFAGPPGAAAAEGTGTAVAMQKVQEVLKKHADLYEKEHHAKATTTKKKKLNTTTPKKQAPAAAAKKEEEQVIEMGTDGGFDISEAAKPTAATPATAAASPSPPSKDKATPAESKPTPAAAAAKDDDVADKKTEQKDANETTADDDDDKKKKDPPPIGNGGTVEGKYVWTQTLSEVNMTIPVPESTRGRDLSVVIAKKHLKVGLLSAVKKDNEWLINAPLTKPIICDDSFWTVEDGNRLVINLQKSNNMEWWETVCEGDTKINIQAIQPETSSLSDLDGETRQTVEKMMVDQRQKALGLPTTDEMNKMAMLEKFKAQHPEMDFSNAKFS